MPTSVKMPRLGESVAEGSIAAWLKKEGDTVERDESIAEIITDKINAELPSPVAGRLTKILVNVDEVVAVDTPIAVIEESADGTAPSPSAEPGHDAKQVKDTTQATTPVMAEQAMRTGTNTHTKSETQTVQRDDEERQRISPLARRLAREHGLNLNDIQGTGTHGRVRKEDILTYLAQQKEVTPHYATTAITSNTAEGQEAPTLTLSTAGEAAPTLVSTDEELLTPSRMRLAIAEHMVRSKRTSPHATTVVEVDMTAIARWLRAHKEEFKQREGYALSYVPFVMKAVCEGIRRVPLINSTWTEENKILVKKQIHLGVAVATEMGLVVPTVHNAGSYTIAGLAQRIGELAQRARNNKLTVQDMQGSTFVVNNPGVFGTIISVPIINQPHAAILSMDAVVKRPVVVDDDAIAVRYMMYLCLSFDHRILDGAGAGEFLQTVRTKLQGYGREIDVY